MGAGARPSDARLDPIALEVIRHGLISATNQIDANITRTAFSPYIYEYKDYAIGLVDADHGAPRRSRRPRGEPAQSVRRHGARPSVPARSGFIPNRGRARSCRGSSPQRWAPAKQSCKSCGKSPDRPASPTDLSAMARTRPQPPFSVADCQLPTTTGVMS